ncbi:TIGR03067 domain-containing protein [Gemmata sp. JC717]|uniref:TIGR03067 domain-containing protein n=1 Tax=Gemmata algarum TaxID=2975278 RepID=UPI0021BAA907|nr:TIGR03067 domain-containing protein [Gemmata algarum]MDY3554623.1 TIGR03067 domain-containing protein [Gemmata algarum]
MKFPALALFAVPFALVCAPGALVLGAPVPKHLMKGEEPDLQKLQGDWKLTEMEINGKNVPPDTRIEIVLEFRGNKLTVVDKHQNQRRIAVIRLDTTANPTRLAWPEARVTTLKGVPVRDEEAEMPCVMIYKFKADTLVLATSGGSRAPRGFDNKDEPGGIQLMTFTRVPK